MLYAFAACEILISQWGIEPGPSAVKAQSPYPLDHQGCPRYALNSTCRILEHLGKGAVERPWGQGSCKKPFMSWLCHFPALLGKPPSLWIQLRVTILDADPLSPNFCTEFLGVSMKKCLMDLEIIVLREVSQTENDKHHTDITYVWNLRK